MHQIELLAGWDFSSLRFPLTVCLGVVATLGYLVGRWSPGRASALERRSRRELRRAESVARELERIAGTIRAHLSRHHERLARFKQGIHRLQGQAGESVYRELCREAEQILTPTLRLATQISTAYDEIRQQSNHLTAFTEIRTDPLTGIGNRRCLSETLAAHFAMHHRYHNDFSLVMFDIDLFKKINDECGHLEGDQVLQRLAKLLDECARETDTVTRYGGEEFVVVMPETDLMGASIFAERVRAAVAEATSVTISAGVASMLDGDTQETLLTRADEALYAAKHHGRDRVYRHDGEQIESVMEDVHILAGEEVA